VPDERFVHPGHGVYAAWAHGRCAAVNVGVAVIGVGYALIQKGIHALKQIDPAPTQTIRTLKEDKLWVKEQLGR